MYDNSWALIVGINDYEAVRDLNYAVEDALAVKNMLINEYGFPRKHVRVLIKQEATQNNIKKELNFLVKSSGQNDRVVFYFAGHGETMDLDEGGEKGYLLPVDGDRERLYLTSIPMDELKNIALMTKAKHLLYLVDACYGGIATVGSRGIQESTSSQYIEKISKNKARQIITAGGQRRRSN